MKAVNVIAVSILSLAVAACSGDSDPQVKADQVPVAQEEMSAGAEDVTANAKIIQALLELDPEVAIVRIRESKIPGLHEVLFRTGEGVDELTYITADGQHMIQGEMLDLAAGRSVTLASVLDRRVELVEAAAKSGIRFPAKVDLDAAPAQTLYVFTDTECTECAELDAAVPELTQAGVNVVYLAFPQQGLQSEGFAELTGVMCASDRGQALTASFSAAIQADERCADTVASHYETGLRLGVTTVPTLVSQTGIHVSGFPGTKTLISSLELAAVAAVPEQEGSGVEG